jgi:hypothetical protein
MQFYTQDQMVDKHVGVKGTAARAEYDEQVELMLTFQKFSFFNENRHF